MDSNDQSPPIQVVIISFPPPNSPCSGKTITAFALTNDGDYPQSHQTHVQEPSATQTHQDFQLPVQYPPLPHQESFYFFSAFLFLLLLCIGLCFQVTFKS